MTVRRLLPLVCALLLTACQAELSGTLTGEGPEFEGMRMSPDSCSSGERELFLGAYLFQSSDSRYGVKIIQDPKTGTVVHVNIPATCTAPGSCQAAVLSKESCATFDVQVNRNMNVEINGMHPVDGYINLDCARPDGSKVRGRVDFEGCR